MGVGVGAGRMGLRAQTMIEGDNGVAGIQAQLQESQMSGLAMIGLQNEFSKQGFQLTSFSNSLARRDAILDGLIRNLKQ